MRKKLNNLIREARMICQDNRKHRMKPFKHNHQAKTAYSECVCCGLWVQVEENPAPNSIDIGGPALAEECKFPLGRELYKYGWRRNK